MLLLVGGCRETPGTADAGVFRTTGKEAGKEIVPMTLKEANAFVEQNHRHHGPVVGHKFSIGLSDGEEVVGVAMAVRLPATWTTAGRWR